MSGQFRYSGGALSGVSGKLQEAANKVEGGAQAPPAPDVGISTAPVLEVIGDLSMSAAGVTDGLTAAGRAVIDNRELFNQNESNTIGMTNDMNRPN